MSEHPNTARGDAVMYARRGSLVSLWGGGLTLLLAAIAMILSVAGR